MPGKDLLLNKVSIHRSSLYCQLVAKRGKNLEDLGSRVWGPGYRARTRTAGLTASPLVSCGTFRRSFQLLGLSFPGCKAEMKTPTMITSLLVARIKGRGFTDSSAKREGPCPRKFFPASRL